MDVVEVVHSADGLHHPALWRVHAERQDRLVRHVAEARVWARHQCAARVEGHLGLQHVAVEAAHKKKNFQFICRKSQCVGIACSDLLENTGQYKA